MKPCCEQEIKANIRKHRDVARCGACGALILAYGVSADYDKMLHQLRTLKSDFETTTKGKLQIVIKL